MATAATDFNDQEEIFLADEDGWKEEARAVISDVTDHVKHIQIADGLKSSRSHIYLNLTILEGARFTVELSCQGFQIVGNEHNSSGNPQGEVYETPYSLLDNVSPGYRQAFGQRLFNKLEKVQKDQENN